MLYYGIFALCNVHRYCKMLCSEWIMIALLKICTHVELQIGGEAHGVGNLFSFYHGFNKYHNQWCESG